MPNDIMCRVEKYKNVYDFWMQLIVFHENLSRLEDKLRENQLKEWIELEFKFLGIKGESPSMGSMGINLNLIFKDHKIYFKCRKREHYKNKSSTSKKAYMTHGEGGIVIRDLKGKEAHHKLQVQEIQILQEAMSMEEIQGSREASEVTCFSMKILFLVLMKCMLLVLIRQ